MQDKPPSGKVALITGASKGLGKTMALALGEAGAKLVLISRDERRLTETAEAIRSAGGEAEVFPADVSREEQVEQLEKKVIEKFGKLDILINGEPVDAL